VHVVAFVGLAMVLTACGTASPTLRTQFPGPVPGAPLATTDEEGADDAGAGVLAAVDYRLTAPDAMPTSVLVAQAPSASGTDPVDEEYDPWEPFNETMFEFNRRLDRYMLKPVAKAYNAVVPDAVQVMISNGYDNINFVPRMVNSLAQMKFEGAARELGRFMLNSTLGIGGLFDVARMEVEPTLGNKVPGMDKSREDFGQTLGFYGAPPGPYLILPLMEPLTVRDGIGKGVDGLMDPLGYFVPFIWARLGMKVGETINDRSLNLELFQGFEESVIDLYSAVRHGYLKRREKLISE
jgi:phospholipid-binding lipoprotein MlaA